MECVDIRSRKLLKSLVAKEPAGAFTEVIAANQSVQKLEPFLVVGFARELLAETVDHEAFE